MKYGYRVEPLEARRLLSLILATTPPLTTSDAGGPVLADPQVALVLWGAGWTNAPTPTATQVQSATSTILTSPYTRDLAAYRPALGAGGSVYNTSFITNSSPLSTFSDADVTAMLETNMLAGMLPRVTVDSHLLYMVVPQPGSTTSGFSGFHSYEFDDQLNRYYYGWTINDGSIDTISYYLSHEIVEAMTDPEGTAIQVEPRDPNNWNEISDGAAQFHSARLNGFVMQSYWLQSKNAYVIGTGAQDISTAAGHLVINGDQLLDTDDVVTVSNVYFDAPVDVTINNESMQLLAGTISDIAINGLSGSDLIRLTLDLPTTVNGGSGTDSINFDSVDPFVPALLLPSVGEDSVILRAGGVKIDATQRIGALRVGPQAVFKLIPVGSTVLTTTGVTLDSGAVLDLNDNDLIVDYPLGGSSPQFFIQTEINNARSSSWKGPGITSTTARHQPFNTTLGVLSASQYKSIYGPAATFDGQTIDSTAVLVKYTYYGDADFNGTVNFDDYSRIEAGLLNERTGWLNGDFDGNGIVDFDDYSLIDLAFNSQASPRLAGRRQRGVAAP